MKIALVTLLDDSFLIGFEGFFKSFLYHNQWFHDSDIDLVVLDNKLSDSSKETISAYYPAIFRGIKYGRYEYVNFSGTHERLQATFYKLDAFSIFEYDRIVFIDSDVTVLGDIKDLFYKYTTGFHGCKSYQARLDRLNDSINSGVFVINSKYINKYTYSSLLKLAKNRQISMPDQRVINNFFRGNIGYINKSFNVEKRMKYTQNFKNVWETKKILHWVATKPWDTEYPNDTEESFKDIEQIWWDYYDNKL
jgi:lipopolysaccharide biosynthesis glycosyltransferase